MKKAFKFYFVFWLVLLVLFNVIAFVSVGWIAYEKYTPSFWIGYGFIMASFFGQLGCAWTAFRAENLQKLFYNIPLFRVSYAGLIASFVVGGLCMLISPLPYWVGVLVCSLVLIITILAVNKAAAAAQLVVEVDEKVKTNTYFIRSLTADAEGLMAKASPENKAACKKVYEALRYSDPMSHYTLAPVEAKISNAFIALEASAMAGEDISAAAEELCTLIADRNRKCKVLK